MNGGSPRRGLVLRLVPCGSSDKSALLDARLGPADGSSLFRVRTAAAAGALVRWLGVRGFDARLLSIEQSESDRARTAAWFKSADNPSLVVSEPLAFPVCRSDVRAAWLMNLPASLSLAASDLSAVGLDGLPGRAEVFASLGDREARTAGMKRRFAAVRALGGRKEMDAIPDADLARGLFRLLDLAGALPGGRAGEWVAVDLADVSARAGMSLDAGRRILDAGREAGALRLWECAETDCGPAEAERSRAAARDLAKAALKELAGAADWVEHAGCSWAFLAAALEGRAVPRCGACGWCLGARPGLMRP